MVQATFADLLELQLGWESAVGTLTQHDPMRSLVQHNRGFHALLRDAAPVRWRDAAGQWRQTQATVIDFCDPLKKRFLAVHACQEQPA